MAIQRKLEGPGIKDGRIPAARGLTWSSSVQGTYMRPDTVASAARGYTDKLVKSRQRSGNEANRAKRVRRMRRRGRA